MNAERVFRHQLLCDLPRKHRINAALDIDFGNLMKLGLRISGQSLVSRARSACSVSDCELTDTYSPAAIDMAPATIPAIPAINTSLCATVAAPAMMLAVEMIPSFAPSTAARNHPMRLTR